MTLMANAKANGMRGTLILAVARRIAALRPASNPRSTREGTCRPPCAQSPPLLDVALLHIRIDDDRRRGFGLDPRRLDLRAAFPFVRALFHADIGERVLVDPPMRGRVARCRQRVVGEKQCRAGGGHPVRESANG